jgi:drug/metabolite transporter (DMT)-like permease
MESHVSKWQVIAVVMFAVLCVSVGEGLLSMGMRRVGGSELAGIRFVLAAATNANVIVGTLLMMVFFGLYALALSWADFSFVLPITATSYLFGALFAHYVIHETVTPTRWIGTLIIMAGVVVVGLGERDRIPVAQETAVHAIERGP